ncbi:hypothetical protein Tco_1180591 [Tanacetum coccineum]
MNCQSLDCQYGTRCQDTLGVTLGRVNDESSNGSNGEDDESDGDEGDGKKKDGEEQENRSDGKDDRKKEENKGSRISDRSRVRDSFDEGGASYKETNMEESNVAFWEHKKINDTCIKVGDKSSDMVGKGGIPIENSNVLHGSVRPNIIDKLVMVDNNGPSKNKENLDQEVNKLQPNVDVHETNTSKQGVNNKVESNMIGRDEKINMDSKTL